MNLRYSLFYKEKKINIGKIYISIIIYMELSKLMEKMTMMIIKIPKL